MPKSMKKKLSNEHRHLFKFGDALALTSYGKFNIFVLISTGGCLMAVAMEIMGTLFISPLAECDLQLGVTMKGYLSTANFLGVITSLYLWGFLGDTHGRRKIIIISMVLSFMITLLSSLATVDWMLILLRFTNGLLIGGAFAVVYAYSGEFHDANHQAKVICWMLSFTSIAMMVIPGLASLFIPSQWSFEVPLIGVLFKPWRLLLIANGLPSIIFAACIFLLPESPKYLLAKGKETEALLILRKMYTLNTGKSSVEFPVIRLMLHEDTADVKSNEGFFKILFKQTRALFSKQFAIKTFAICILQFGIFMVTFGFYVWYPEVMNNMTVFERENIGEKSSICRAIKYQSVHRHRINNTAASTCKEEMKPEAYTVSFLMGAFFTVTYLTIGSLINIVGKKNLLLLLFVTSALSGLTAQCLSGSTIVKIFMGCALLSSTGGSVIIAIVVDLYPTHIRAMAIAVSLMLGQLGAVSGMHVSGLIFYNLCNFAYPIFAAFHIVVIVLVLLLPTNAKMIEPII